MSRRLPDPTPSPGEVRRSFIAMYLSPSGWIEERLMCSVCVELTKPAAKRMAALSGQEFCEGCGCEVV